MDQAIVTPRGILFDEKFYSCTLAIRNRWFETALILGEWSITICYERDTVDTVIVIIFEDEPSEAYSLNNSFDISKVEVQRYQRDFRLLREKRNLHRLNKTKPSHE